MKKVIVTGANGFVGRYLLRELCRLNYEVYSIVRNTEEKLKSIENLNTHIVYCDMEDISRLKEVIRADDYECFYHLAWSGSSGADREKYEVQFLNAKYCVDAAKVASDLGCKRFVGAGSVTELMYEEYLKQDGSKPEMVTCYAVGKIAAEYMTKCICTERGIDFLWGYISNFYGAEDTTQNIINYLIDNYAKGISPELTNGNQKADFIYVSDVARALVTIAEEGKPNSSYYIGYGEPRPLREFVTEIRDTVNPNIDTGLGKKMFQGIDIDFEKINYRKLNNDTGFAPIIDFTEGIKRTLEWRNNCFLQGV